MRVNLTKKDLVNSVYMQIGFSKKISENMIDDFFLTIIESRILFLLAYLNDQTVSHLKNLSLKLETSLFE